MLLVALLAGVAARGAADRQVGAHARQEAGRAQGAGHRGAAAARLRREPAALADAYGARTLLAVGVVGVAWCLFDRPWRQGWHDKAARTFVAAG